MMVSSIVAELLEAAPSQPAMLPYAFADEEILGLTPTSAIVALKVEEATEDQLGHLATAAELASRLRDRRLLARGFAFSSKMPLDPYRNDSLQRVGVDELNRAARDPRRRSQVVSRLLEEAELISAHLDLPPPSRSSETRAQRRTSG